MSKQNNLDQTPQQNIASSNGEENNFGLTRRQFLGRSAAVALGMPILAACTIPYPAEVPAKQVAADAVTTQPSQMYTPLQFIETEPGYIKQPAYIQSENGKLNIKMEMKHLLQKTHIKVQDEDEEKYIEGEAKIGAIVVNDTPMKGSQQYPAPTLRVKKGDEVTINITNNLEYSEDEVEHHDPNITNMHYHGLHASPGSPLLEDSDPYNRADNIFAEIEQGETRPYQFTISEKQRAGTHWYHPHNHGTTGLNVVNGMSGTLIVEGDFNFEELGDNQPKDIVLFFQQIAVHTFGGGTEVNYPTVKLWINGEENPTIKMEPGEIQRWRIVNGTMKAETAANIISVPVLGEETLGDITDLALRQIAQDGVQFHDDQLILGQQNYAVNFFPGKRVDYLVQAPKSDIDGSWIQQVQLKFAIMDSDGMPTGEFDTKNLLKIDYTPMNGTSNPNEIVDLATTSLTNSNGYPDYLRPVADSELETTQEEQDLYGLPAGRRRRAVIYTLQGAIDPETGEFKAKFMVDGEQFSVDNDPAVPSHCMILGEAEEWTIYNTNDFAHPFHIHVNPFFVTDIYDPANTFEREEHDKDDPATHTFQPMRWLDTILLPAATTIIDNEVETFNPGYVVIRQRYIDFHGDFVNHCHFLDHEDKGMMQRVRITKSREDADGFLEGRGWEDKITFGANPAVDAFGDMVAQEGTTPPSWATS